MLLEIVDDSETSYHIIELIVSTHKPNDETLPEVIQFLFLKPEIRLKVSSFDMFGIFPGWSNSFLKDEKSVDLFRPISWIGGF
jgi:hypothetical protein